MKNVIKNLFFIFFLFMAAPSTYGSSWTRGRIEAPPGAYGTATATPILNPQSKGRGQTGILSETLGP